MTRKGHKLTGFGTAVFCAGLFWGTPLEAIASAAFAASASVWPDSLEMAWWSWSGKRHSVIPHRTITHWPFIWGGALVGSLFTPSFISVILVGIGLGGLTHLLYDFVTYEGIPILNPFRKYSLKLMKSGQWEIPLALTHIVLCTTAALFINGVNAFDLIHRLS